MVERGGLLLIYLSCPVSFSLPLRFIVFCCVIRISLLSLLYLCPLCFIMVFSVRMVGDFVLKLVWVLYVRIMSRYLNFPTLSFKSLGQLFQLSRLVEVLPILGRCVVIFSVVFIVYIMDPWVCDACKKTLLPFEAVFVRTVLCRCCLFYPCDLCIIGFGRLYL